MSVVTSVNVSHNIGTMLSDSPGIAILITCDYETNKLQLCLEPGKMPGRCGKRLNISNTPFFNKRILQKPKYKHC